MSNDPPFFARTKPWIFEAACLRTFQAGALRSRGAMAAALYLLMLPQLSWIRELCVRPLLVGLQQQ